MARERTLATQSNFGLRRPLGATISHTKLDVPRAWILALAALAKRKMNSSIRMIVCLACVAGLNSTIANERIRMLSEGPQAGHYLFWKGKPGLLIGDSVTQGWMECGTNFNQTAYVDALAKRGLNLLMIWAFKGTCAERQRQDRRLGYDAPELWPWVGSPDDGSFDLHQFNRAYFDRLRGLVAYAESKGIVVLITVHDGWTKTCFDGHPFNRALGNGPLARCEQYVELGDRDQEMPARFDPR